MVWIESHCDLADHPKTLRLAGFLGVDVPTAIGHLHLLWWWAMRFAKDGLLEEFSEPELAHAARWRGDSREFVEALIRSRFVDLDPIRLHDWDQYGGKLENKRAANAERNRRARATHVQGTSASRDTHERITSASRDALEERREENSTGEERSTRGAGARASEALPAGFEAFWAVYPHRVEKKAAVAEWRRLGPDAGLQQAIVSAVEAQLRTRKWREGFVKAPHRWLKDRNWEDEIPVEPIPIQAARGSSRRAETEEALEAFLRIANGEDA